MLCLIGAWKMPQICLKDAWNMPERCRKGVSKVPYGELCLIDAWKMPEICLKYAWNMPEICLKDAWKMPERCLKDAWKMPERCFKGAIRQAVPDMAPYKGSLNDQSVKFRKHNVRSAHRPSPIQSCFLWMQPTFVPKIRVHFIVSSWKVFVFGVRSDVFNTEIAFF